MQSTPDAGSAIVSKAMPRDMPRGPGKQIGLRASITSGAADGSVGGIFECRVFDPSDPVKAQAGLQGDENGIWVLRVPVDAGEWIPSGEVGLFAQRTRASFSSLDVMQAP